jgi:hypothetical protein
MATRVNIAVDIDGLKEKSRAQILAGRASLTRKEEGIKTETVAKKKRTEQRIKQGLDPITGQKIGSSGGSIITAGLRGIAGYRGSSGPRVDEEPAGSSGSRGDAFLIVINSNAARDDNFTLQLRGPGQVDYINYDGIMNFDLNEASTYFYTSKPVSLNDLFSSAAYEQIELILNDVAGLDNVVYKQPFFSLKGFRPKRQYVQLKMVNVKQNFNGNFGYLIYGFLSKKDVYNSTWSAGDGLNIVYPEFDWFASQNLGSEEQP